REKVPDFFAINIQQEDLSAIQQYFIQHSSGLSSLSPMLLGRLSLINGTPPEKESFSTRPLRLSYRAKKFDSETVVEGLDELPPYDESQEKAFLSVEEDYAKRNSLKLNDNLTFILGGLEIEAQIKQ